MPLKNDYGFKECPYPGCGTFKKRHPAQKFCEEHKGKHSERAVRKLMPREDKKKFIELIGNAPNWKERIYGQRYKREM